MDTSKTDPVWLQAIQDLTFCLAFGIPVECLPVDPRQRAGLAALLERGGPVESEEVLPFLTVSLEQVMQDDDTVSVLCELAKAGRESDFRDLTASCGVPSACLDGLWRGTRVRLGLAPR